MAWTWSYDRPADLGPEHLAAPEASGAGAAPLPLPEPELFASQSDAESWLGEFWRQLAAAGVTSVTLLEDGASSYSMSLESAG